MSSWKFSLELQTERGAKLSSVGLVGAFTVKRKGVSVGNGPYSDAMSEPHFRLTKVVPRV